MAPASDRPAPRKDVGARGIGRLIGQSERRRCPPAAAALRPHLQRRSPPPGRGRRACVFRNSTPSNEFADHTRSNCNLAAGCISNLLTPDNTLHRCATQSAAAGDASAAFRPCEPDRAVPRLRAERFGIVQRCSALHVRARPMTPRLELWRYSDFRGDASSPRECRVIENIPQ